MLNIPIDEQIKAIESSESLGDLPAKYWPNSHSEKYLFISYSHLDYKLVFKDILLFQQMGINVWYDKSISLGSDWANTAEQAISNYNCIGVIFYLTENSIKSEAIATEIRYVKKRNKPYFSINKPISVDGKETLLSARQMYELVNKDNMNEKIYSIISDMFNEKVIYLSTDDDIENKTDKIKQKLKQGPLFNFAVSEFRKTSKDLKFNPQLLPIKDYNFMITTEGFATLRSVNNIDLLHADDIPEVVTVDDKEYFLTKIDNCAFANCKKLESIKLPRTLQIIKPNAFYGCESLESLTIPDTVMQIGSSAICGCIELKELILPSHLRVVRNWAFAGCLTLKKIFIPKGIELMEENCFVNCHDVELYFEEDEVSPNFDPRFNVENRPMHFGVTLEEFKKI